jgi:hypothetical protein
MTAVLLQGGRVMTKEYVQKMSDVLGAKKSTFSELVLVMTLSMRDAGISAKDAAAAIDLAIDYYDKNYPPHAADCMCNDCTPEPKPVEEAKRRSRLPC